MDDILECQLRVMAVALAELRHKLGLSQGQTVAALRAVGAKISSQSLISDWEQGKRVPPPQVLIAYSKAFNADIRYVVGEVKGFLPRDIEFDITDKELEAALNRLRNIDPIVYDDVKDYIAYLVEKREADTG